MHLALVKGRIGIEGEYKSLSHTWCLYQHHDFFFAAQRLFYTLRKPGSRPTNVYVTSYTRWLSHALGDSFVSSQPHIVPPARVTSDEAFGQAYRRQRHEAGAYLGNQ